MKKFFLYLAILLSVSTVSYSQNNGDFQSYSCNWSLTLGVDDFQNGCFGSNWKTANLKTGGSIEGAYAGTASSGLESGNYFGRLFTTNPQTQNIGYSSESIYYEGITFNPNTQYTVTCRIRWETGQASGDMFKVNLYNTLPASMTGTYIVGSETDNNTSWHTVSFTFTPDATYTQICFYNISVYATLNIDDIQITSSCCDPFITYANTSALPFLTQKAIYINTTSGTPVTVLSSQNSTFQAGDYIELNPGFETQTNSNFLAFNSPCASNSFPADAGLDRILCRSLGFPCPFTLGTTSDPSATYSWSSTPSFAVGILSSTSVSNPYICGSTPYVIELRNVAIEYNLTVSNSCTTTTDQVIIRYGRCHERIGYLEEGINSSDGHIVYPNPSGGKFDLLLPSYMETAKITIKDMNGKVIFSSISKEKEVRIELENQRSGMYFVSIESNGETINDKIIIQ